MPARDAGARRTAWTIRKAEKKGSRRASPRAPIRALLLSLPLAFSLAAPGLFGAPRAEAQTIGFLSTQLRPVEEVTRVRTVILKDFPGKVAFIPTFPEQFLVQATADAKRARPALDVLGGLHGEIAPLVAAGLLAPVDPMSAQLAALGMPASLMTLARLGTPHAMYVPWMQATYIMAANSKALPYLPQGAELDRLSYAGLAQWAANITRATGKRMLGFPAGPKGLMPASSRAISTPPSPAAWWCTFRSPQAEAMWA